MEKIFIKSLENAVADSIKVILLTDCSNAHAAVHAVQPRAVDKSTRILLNYIRDHLPFAAITFVDAGFNVADLGTKQSPNSKPWTLLVQENQFSIGFLGREKYKELMAIKDAEKSKSLPIHFIKKVYTTLT